jgi:hypothetical protein
MVRWSSEPRRTPVAEESWAASFSRLRMACSRVITSDDTYMLADRVNTFLNKMFNASDVRSMASREAGDVRSSKQPRTAPMKTKRRGEEL